MNRTGVLIAAFTLVLGSTACSEVGEGSRVGAIRAAFDSFAGQTGESDDSAAPAPDCRVGRVVDGDSLDCADGRRLRLLLIDAPELDQDPFGPDARGAMGSIAPVGTRVFLDYDIERQDDYGRELVYVTLEDGTSVNEEMLRAGFAVVIVFPPNVRHVERYRAVSDSAREAARGLWAVDGFACFPIAHRQGRC